MEFFEKAFNWLANLSNRLPKINFEAYFIVVLAVLAGIFVIIALTYIGSRSGKLKNACKKIVRYLANVESIDDDNVKAFTEECFSQHAPQALRDSWVQYLGVRFGFPSDIVSDHNVYDVEVKKPREIRANIFLVVSLILLALFAFWGYGTLTAPQMGVIHCAGLLLIALLYLVLIIINHKNVKACLDAFNAMQEDLDAKVILQVEKNYATDSSPLAQLSNILDEIVARNTAKEVETEPAECEKTPIEELIDENPADEEEVIEAEIVPEDEAPIEAVEEAEEAEEAEPVEEVEEAEEAPAEEEEEIEEAVEEPVEEEPAEETEEPAAEEAIDEPVEEETEEEAPAEEQPEEPAEDEQPVEEEPSDEVVEEPVEEEPVEEAEEAPVEEQPEEPVEEEIEEAPAEEAEEAEGPVEDEQPAEEQPEEEAPSEEQPEEIQVMEPAPEEDDVKPAKLVNLPNLIDYIDSLNLSRENKMKIAAMLMSAYPKFKDKPEEKKIFVECAKKLINSLMNG